MQKTDGGKLLCMAIQEADMDILISLLEKGCDVNEPDHSGFTPLMEAAASDVPDFVRLLLSAGADVNLCDRHGDTALSWAVSNINDSSLDILKILLEWGADPHIANDDGDYPVMTAAELGFYDGVVLLAEKMNDINVRDKNERTVLMRAVTSRDSGPRIIEYLCRKGIGDINAQDDIYETALIKAIHAAQKNMVSPEMIKILLSHGADTNMRIGSLGETALTIWAEKEIPSAEGSKQTEKIMDMLIEHGAKINEPLHNGTTPLLKAVYMGNTAAVRCLLNKGADAGVKNDEGVTASFYAMGRKDLDILAEFILHNAVSAEDAKKIAEHLEDVEFRGVMPRGYMSIYNENMGIAAFCAAVSIYPMIIPILSANIERYKDNVINFAVVHSLISIIPERVLPVLSGAMHKNKKQPGKSIRMTSSDIDDVYLNKPTRLIKELVEAFNTVPDEVAKFMSLCIAPDSIEEWLKNGVDGAEELVAKTACRLSCQKEGTAAHEPADFVPF